MNKPTGLGYALRVLMAITDKSSAEMAAGTGLSVNQISQLRSDRSINPTLKTLTLLAMQFNLSIDQFLSFHEKVLDLYEQERTS